MSDQAAGVAQELEQRVSYLDVAEQQLEAMKSQAHATIASCDGALVTIRLLKSQLATARKLAEERLNRQKTEKTAPATFGRHRQQPAAAATGDQTDDTSAKG